MRRPTTSSMLTHLGFAARRRTASTTCISTPQNHARCASLLATNSELLQYGVRLRCPARVANEQQQRNQQKNENGRELVDSPVRDSARLTQDFPIEDRKRALVRRGPVGAT